MHVFPPRGTKSLHVETDDDCTCRQMTCRTKGKWETIDSFNRFARTYGELGLQTRNKCSGQSLGLTCMRTIQPGFTYQELLCMKLNGGTGSIYMSYILLTLFVS